MLGEEIANGVEPGDHEEQDETIGGENDHADEDNDSGQDEDAEGEDEEIEDDGEGGEAMEED